jgi:hypothetical protein
MPARLTPNRRFSKPIVTHDGTRLETIYDALAFLEALPDDRVTVTIYYAHTVLKDARDKGKPSNVEKARSELTRAFGQLGWI